jgi:hypothetical protein
MWSYSRLVTTAATVALTDGEVWALQARHYVVVGLAAADVTDGARRLMRREAMGAGYRPAHVRPGAGDVTEFVFDHWPCDCGAYLRELRGSAR